MRVLNGTVYKSGAMSRGNGVLLEPKSSTIHHGYCQGANMQREARAGRGATPVRSFIFQAQVFDYRESEGQKRSAREKITDGRITASIGHFEDDLDGDQFFSKRGIRFIERVDQARN